MSTQDPSEKYSFEVLQKSWLGLESLVSCVLALFPVTTDEAVYIGSGFIVAPDVQFVTARHVASELAENDRQTYGEARACALLVGDVVGGLVQITRLNMDPEASVNSDLATGQLDMSAIQSRPAYLQLSSEPGRVGEAVSALGHAYLPGQTFVNEAGVFSMEGQLTVVRSPIAQVLEKRPNLPAPSFLLEQEMPGGMSGGPIIRDATGEVVGVCSYGLALNTGEHDPYCYGSGLGPLWQSFGAGTD
jgi:hypothetical protein